MYHGDMFNFSASTLAFGDSLYFVTEQENKAKTNSVSFNKSDNYL